MTEPQPTIPNIPPSVPASQPGVFGTKIPSSVTFIVAILLFFMPFIDITCNSMSLQTISGVQLATGFKVKAGNSNSLLGNMDNMNTNNTSKGDREEPNSYALVALGLGILGVILSFQNVKAGGIGGLITGGLSAVALIGLIVDVKKKISSKIPDTEAQVNVSVNITPWLYITIITFLAAAFFSYKRMKANVK